MVPQANVLIVTATPVESRAVIDAFADLTGQPTRPVSVGDRVYHDLGEVHDTRVFLALTEMGSGGLGASQQTVQKGITALQPAAVILVGIAFGVDEQKQAIGDVLVSRQLLLYESERVGEGKIIPRGDKPHASPWLVNYLNSAQLYWSEPTIAVRFGLVLSGEKLVDHLDYREQLKQFGPETIGGEMEGAGLYVACQDAKVDWILVKAICDWADGHKAQDQDARQRLAARNAAAFVAHALQHVALRHPESVVEVPIARQGYSPGFKYSNQQVSNRWMRDQQRLKRHTDDLQQQWELLNKRLNEFKKQLILETRVEEKFCLRNLIDDTQNQCNQVEEQLKNIESQLAKSDSDVIGVTDRNGNHGQSRNDDQSLKKGTKKTEVMLLHGCIKEIFSREDDYVCFVLKTLKRSIVI